MQPQVGKNVLVRHRSNGQGKLQLSNDERVLPITAVYLDGTVRVSSGDVWDIQSGGDGKAAWKTSHPKL